MVEPARSPDPASDDPEADLRQAVLQTFLAESEERLFEMEEALIALERQPDEADAVQTIFRCAHTLKGNASALGFPTVAEFAHAMEDLLQQWRSRALPVTTDSVSLLLRGVDALRRMVLLAPAGRDDLDVPHRDLLRRIRAASSGEQGFAADLSRDAAPWVHQSAGRAEAAPAARERHGRTRTLRVDVRKLDRLLDLTGEIAIAEGRLSQVLRRRDTAFGDDALDVHREVRRLFNELQEVILNVRMVPVGPLFRRHVRTVRDIAHSLGKSARLIIEGEDVEVDTVIVESLDDPITHMIRNALDHGIESPELRAAGGKDPVGRVTLRAAHRDGHVVIEVEDDGAGLDRDKILSAAKAAGLAADGDPRSDQETLRLIFEPGFSTSATVTELSGRGVGMDVVRRNVEALRGSVAVESRKHAGTRISIRLPLTVAVIDGFTVGVADDTVVIPLGAVLECLELPDNARDRAAPTGVIQVRGEAVPYLRLREVFGRGGAPAARESLVVVRDDARRAGFVVDALYGEGQAVIKPLGTLCRGARGISGATILGDGRVALIMDVPGVLRRFRHTTPAQAA
jgi:two-component system chemotaxis sensor kinase CheA